jgi:MoxR-like ATPase
MALLRGRDFVVPDDVKGFVVEALAHRTLLKIEDMLSGAAPHKVVREAVATVAVPRAAGSRPQVRG